MFQPDNMTDEQRRACRQIAKEQGPLGVYARMALALDADRGVRLSRTDVWDILVADESSKAALDGKIIEVLYGAG